MRAQRLGSRTRGPLGLAVVLVLLGPGSGAADGPTWHVERGDVRVTVPLKPGGAFAATTTALSGTVSLLESTTAAKPARLAGEITMGLGAIDTGIALRDRHLRENYLEIGKGAGFDKAVLTDIRLSDADGEAFEGNTGFTATLLLHGVAHAVTGKAEVRREGAGRRVRAEFPLTLTDFGITPPEYLGVGVGNKLLVKVQFTATPAPSAGK